MTITSALLQRIADQHGDAFYLLDGGRFEANYRRFLDAFRARYARTQFAYSYKTNYTPRLCRIVQSLGGLAEVVSGMEYELARRLGVDPERIVFNGPYKPEPELRRALLEGATVNLDSEPQVEQVEELARRRPDRSLTVGLRCNFSPATGTTSRFGFDADRVDDVFARLARLDNCSVAGLHCHFCTPQKSLDLFANITDRMLEIAQRLYGDRPPGFLNLGGGFFSPMSADLRRQFPAPVPDYEDYAEAIAPRFAKRYPDGDGPELILEPGVALVADVMRFVARVVETKTIGRRRLAVVSGSVYNIKPTKNAKNLPLAVYGARAATSEATMDGPFDIVGYTCMEDDLLHSGHDGPLARGQFVVFDNVGAYSVVLKPPFIFPCPPILELSAGAGAPTVVKRAETADDIFSTFQMG